MLKRYRRIFTVTLHRRFLLFHPERTFHPPLRRDIVLFILKLAAWQWVFNKARPCCLSGRNALFWDFIYVFSCIKTELPQTLTCWIYLALVDRRHFCTTFTGYCFVCLFVWFGFALFCLFVFFCFLFGFVFVCLLVCLFVQSSKSE